LTFLKALRHFVREAWVGLARSWRVSILAVFTIGVSLFLAGSFLLASRNLARAVAAWKEEARFVVYLAGKAGEDDRRAVEAKLRASPWAIEVTYVSPEQGAARFRRAFPSLAELVDDARYGRLPASVECRFRALAGGEQEAFASWSKELAAMAAVETVDDDRDWIRDVETILAVVRAVGSVLTGVLLGAAIFTIAAVVRLTSFLYRDEIAVMRLVGATEFYIRGPFYAEGILQGLLGAAAAVGALEAVHLALRPRLDDSLVLSIVARDFLPAAEIGAILLFGALSGLAGAMVSLGRERAASEAG
jgi:cell division transport system permease protein